MAQLLPVEMWCKIFRTLDGPSVLAASRACPMFLDIIQEDPILKHVQRKALDQENLELRMKIITSQLQSLSKEWMSIALNPKRRRAHMYLLSDLTLGWVAFAVKVSPSKK
ncbi:hypothetical protein HUJ05_011884 [Dendroctonus ponderosae]|nr:hypothetical protein HUJ05_011884 [Dendroctonus ponderosae]